jgi:hypothetical protein
MVQFSVSRMIKTPSRKLLRLQTRGEGDTEEEVADIQDYNGVLSSKHNIPGTFFAAPL